MATIKEQEELMQVLKFTPRTYKIRLWGYGGEYVMGTVDRKIYDYFRRCRLDVSEFAWNDDYAETQNIPEDMQPFPAGLWHEGDDIAHVYGVDRSAGTIQVEDEHGNVVFEKRLEDVSGFGEDDENPDPEWLGGDEYWIDMKPAGTVVFIATSSEKGTFFEGDIELKSPFNPGRIGLKYDEIDGNEIITGVEYEGVEIDNWGGDTSGKGSEHGFYVAGSNKQDGKGYEKYRNIDDIEYKLTDWFPAKVKPEREGHYEIKTKDGYTYRANWNGTDWRNTWGDEPDKVKVKEWRGVAYNPDEQDLREELDRIVLETPAGWPFAGPTSEETTVTEESKSKWWTVKTYHKKSCEQHEHFVQREGEGRIKVVDGFRFCTYNVETNDGEFPQFEFTTVPGGNAAKDSIDMNSISGANIENSELVEMFDGGCWGDVEITGLSNEDEEKVREFLEENTVYELEDEGEWYLEDTECWVWGPLEVTDDEGNTRIVIADENGNMVDFVED